MAHPLPWAIAAGAAADALATGSGWVAAAPVDRVLALLGASATPVALFALGAMLVVATAGPTGAAVVASSTQAAPDLATARLPLGRLVLTKLLVHPALVWAAVQAASLGGAPLTPTAHAALVLTAALPCASNVVLLADRHRADAPAIARLVVASTLAALPAVLLWAVAVVPAG